MTLVIAHRGSSGTSPENTLAAFRKALDAKVDCIELDIHQTADEKIVVIHDSSVDRTTNGNGKVCCFTSEHIKSLDAGTWFHPNFSTEQIPTLEEIIQLVAGKAVLFIELKKGEQLYEGIEKRTLELLSRYDARKWCILHSFDNPILKNIHRLDKKIPLFKTIELNQALAKVYFEKSFPFSDTAHYKNLKGINVNFNVVTPAFVRQAHKKELQVFAWTVNKEEDMKKMLTAGVDGIISNYPEKIQRIYSENGVLNGVFFCKDKSS